MKFTDIIINSYNPDTFKANDVIKMIMDKYTNVDTIQNYLSAVRTGILKKIPINGYDNAYEYLKINKVKTSDLISKELNNLFLPKDLALKRRKKGNDNLIKKHNQMIVIPNSEEFIKDIINGLKSKKYDELLPALLLTTGRRVGEITSTAKFSCKNGKIMFSGQLKTTNKNPYEIELLDSTIRTVQGALRKLRKIIKDENWTSKQINSKNQYIFDKLSKKYNIKLIPHNLRGIYATILFSRYNGLETKNIFFKKLLGHVDLETSLNYVNYKLE